MRATERLVDDLADAILDGTPVDWAVAESSADAAVRPLVRRLRTLAAVADLARGDQGLAPQTIDADGRPRAGVEEHWGHLRLVEPIGRGAFGDVYRAWDTRLDREVALKLLPAARQDDDRTASTIIDEGRLLARVRHPNVVTIYGAEQISDRVGLWMELVRGQTLEQILGHREVIGADEAVGIGLELCRAMSAVHGAGLLHRDIKTQNVMQAEDGRIVLMDFGTGRELADDASSDLAGTPLYLAPEVLNGQQATVQSDVYSLGVLLFHLVTGSYPVHARTVRGIRSAHARGERTVVRDARAGVPRRLARLIERAIDVDPTRRYQSAEALGAELAALTPRARTARRATATGLAAAAILTGIVGWEIAGRQAGSARTPGELLSGVAESSSVAAVSVADDLDASELCAQANALLSRRGIPNAQKAVELFQRAIELDSEFAPAYAGLANAYAFWSFPFRGLSYERAHPIIREAAVKALELDSSLPEAHAAMGWVYAFEHDLTNARLQFQQAIHLNSSLAQSYTSYSVSTLQPLREFDEALGLLNEAARKDPLSLDVQREIGEVLLFAGRYEEAIETFDSVIDREPDFPFVQAFRAKALAFTGRAEEAIDPLLELETGSPWLAYAYVAAGRRAEAERLAADFAYDSPYRLTVISAALGKTQGATDALEQAAISEPHRIGRLLIEPELASLRDHPRVVAIRKEFGLP